MLRLAEPRLPLDVLVLFCGALRLGCVFLAPLITDFCGGALIRELPCLEGETVTLAGGCCRELLPDLTGCVLCAGALVTGCVRCFTLLPVLTGCPWRTGALLTGCVRCLVLLPDLTGCV